MNLFVAPGHIALWILVAGLFLPRLTLVAAWIMNAYPPNTLPDIGNFLLWLFIPRFLMAYYIYMDSGPNNLWFWAYIVAGLIGFMGESRVARRRVRRRTQVTRDGNTVTTIEEEEV